jgi:hypothetical protein
MAQESKLKPGVLISLRASGNQVIERTVVRCDERVVYVCLPQEYLRASKIGEEPCCVGFRKSDIIKLVAQGM